MARGGWNSGINTGAPIRRLTRAELEQLPGPRHGRGSGSRRRLIEALEAYQDACPGTWSAALCAARLGVNQRTIARYRKALRALEGGAR